MPLLIRKVNTAKWLQGQEGFECNEIPADTLMVELRTNDNKLSFWRCDNENERHIIKTALAITANAKNYNKIDIAWIDVDDVEKNGLAMENRPGNTVAKGLENDHVDIVNLDSSRYEEIAKLIFKSVNTKKCRRISAGDIVEQVAQAVRDDVVRIEDLLDGGVKRRVERILED